jgi:hypothetical protein
MGSTTRDTYTPNSPPSENIGALESSIVSGSVIRQSDINTILQSLINWCGHTHNYYDLTNDYDYGNLNGGTSASTETSSGPYSRVPRNTFAPYYLNGQVTASDFNVMANLCYYIQDHYHTVVDN